MNETQYYSAKLYKENVIVCPIDFSGEILYQVVGKIDYYTHKGYLDDLTPVKFVPQEAAVIEGMTAERFKAFLIHSQHDGCSDTYSGLNQWAETQRVLIAQLTPPKPRPAEPKGFGAVVEAGCSSFLPEGERKKWVSHSSVYPQSGWHSEMSSKGYLSVGWSLLIDPIILDAGQVK